MRDRDGQDIPEFAALTACERKGVLHLYALTRRGEVWEYDEQRATWAPFHDYAHLSKPVPAGAEA